MEREQLEGILENAQPGTKLRLTFNAGTGRKLTLDDETNAAVVFFVLMKDKNIIIREMDWATMYAVGTSGYWSNDDNRKVEVEIPQGFNRDWFVGRVQRGLEQVEILT